MENEFRRAVVMGCACVITSRLTVEQIEKFKRYMPEMFVMVDEEGETVFTLDIDSETPGMLSKDKAVYSTTKTPDGKATITIVIDPDAEDKAELVKKHFGTPLLMLDEIENALLSCQDALDEKIRVIDGMISRS